MPALRLPTLWPSWLTRPLELRIDVEQPGGKPLQEQLTPLYDRLKTPGDRLHGIPEIGLNHPDLVIRWREADGEFYVYVEDRRSGQLAGYTVFNRLIEVDRRADRLLRSPHSKYDERYQRRGLATAVYRWGLDAGLCLMTGARQSPGAHALWHKLARHYAWGYADLRDKTLTHLGQDISPQQRDDLHTRMFLLGRPWQLEQFAAAVQMR